MASISTVSLTADARNFNHQVIPEVQLRRQNHPMVERAETFADRLTAFKREKTLSLEALGNMAGGVSPQAVHKWLNGGAIEDANLQALANSSGLPAGWWRYGGTRAAGAVAEVHAPYRKDAVMVPVYAAEGSMGPGRAVTAPDTVVGGIQLSREWMDRNLRGVSSLTNLSVISAYGDSMSPTFNDGDILLVDKGYAEIKLDAVFVFGRGDELLVKRAHRMLNGDVVIRGDNPASLAENIVASDADRFRVLGRVIYAWSGKRL